jgi:hypothetical protein
MYKSIYTHRPYSYPRYSLGVKTKGMKTNIKALAKRVLTRLVGEERANVMVGVLGAIFLSLGVLMAFILNGVVAPGLYQMSEDAMPLTEANATAMRDAAATNLTSTIGVVGMVFMLLGFVMIIQALWGTIGGFFGGRVRGGGM